MAAPFNHLLIAAVSLAAICCVAVASRNVRADDAGAAAYAQAELLRWHSGLAVTGDFCVDPEWKSKLSAMDHEDSAALLVMHGAAGFRDVAEKGFYYSFDPSDAPASGFESARERARLKGDSALRAR